MMERGARTMGFLELNIKDTAFFHHNTDRTSGRFLILDTQRYTHTHTQDNTKMDSKNSKSMSGKKRQYKDRGTRNTRVRLLNNPKRGAPGILLTCEQGKERKCQREGLEMINHYYNSRLGVAAAAAAVDAKGDGCAAAAAADGDESKPEQHEQQQQEEAAEATLSLEDELKQLQQQSSNNNTHDPQQPDSNFGIFATNCRGTVFALCTVPGSEMIPSVKAQKKLTSKPDENDDDGGGGGDGGDDEPETKKQRTDSENSPSDAGVVVSETAATPPSTTTEDAANDTTNNTSHATGNPQWDPVPIVRQILQDAENDSAKDAPSSRFVTRMIPIQVTCYASEEELQIASRSLMQMYLPPSTSSFAVAVKRRFCPHQLTKDKIIDTVANEVFDVLPQIKVNLDNPDVTVIVEICKTMCGISVIPKCKEHFGNFNLAVARDDHDEDE